MTDYEKCVFIRQQLMTRVSELILHKESYVPGNLKEFAARIKATYDLLPIDITKLSRDQMVDLGFGVWNEGSLMLIPGWLCIFLTPELEVICINDTHATMSKTDTDLMFGRLAYGIIPAAQPHHEPGERIIEPNL